MHIDEAYKVFNQLFDTVDGFHLSMENRRRLDSQAKELTYGEITFEALETILKLVKPKGNEIFYDLGCGTGKVVIGAALLAQWKSLVGIEILEDVYAAAEDIKVQYDLLPQKITYNLPPITFILGNLITYDFSDADVIYIASTCFDYDFMHEFADACSKLKPGARIITLTKELDNPALLKKHTLTVPMTWGNTTIHIYERS